MPKELPNAVSQWGAAMGRPNCITEPNVPVKFRLVALRLNGDYDQGGAYWGYTRGTRIYHAWGDGNEEEQEMFVRARHRMEASCMIRHRFPNCRFYR